MRARSLWVALSVLACLTPAALCAGTADASAQPSTPASDDDLDLDKVHPDFTVIDLPTTLRLPRLRLAFRVTHHYLVVVVTGGREILAACEP